MHTLILLKCYILDPDGIGDDGVYSGYILPHCLDQGRVNIKVHVSGAKGMTKISKKVIGAPSITEGIFMLNMLLWRCKLVWVQETCHVLRFKKSKIV